MTNRNTTLIIFAAIMTFSLASCASQQTEETETVDSSSNEGTLAMQSENTDIGAEAETTGETETTSPIITMTDDTKKDKPLDAISSSPATRTDAEWREILTDEQYLIMRECGTERAFSGKYWNTKTPGEYLCAGCGEKLFDSDEKYESGSGWPSFWQTGENANIGTITDNSLGMARTEITCGKCGAHLGHLFDDGPQPTGLRYCVNSASLTLSPDSDSGSNADTVKKADK